MRKNLLVILSLFIGIGVGIYSIGKKMNKILDKIQKSSEKFFLMYQMLEQWMEIKQNNKSLIQYFQINNWLNIAIYGMGDVGELLAKELHSSNINILYGIDKNSNLFTSLKLYHPDDELPEVEVIVVTAIAYFSDIKKNLSQKVNCPIISLEDIILGIV